MLISGLGYSQEFGGEICFVLRLKCWPMNQMQKRYSLKGSRTSYINSTIYTHNTKTDDHFSGVAANNSLPIVGYCLGWPTCSDLSPLTKVDTILYFAAPIQYSFKRKDSVDRKCDGCNMTDCGYCNPSSCCWFWHW